MNIFVFRSRLGLFTKFASIVLFIIVSVEASLHVALAQVAPSLGTAQSFAVLGASTVTNTGPTIVTGDLGVSPGTAVTGFPPGIVLGGTIHASDALAAQAQSDTTVAYNNLAGQACDTTFGVPTDIGGQTLSPGVYCFLSSAQITGTITLDAGGDPNAVWVFKVGSTLTTASNSSVLLINGAQQCNVFWQVGSSATIGTGSTFIGNILALTSITLTTNATISGRALARNGAVTMDSNTIAISACALPTPGTPFPPSLGKAFSPATINEGGTSTLIITLSNPDSTIASITAPLTDTLPSGLVVANNASTTCGGVVTVGFSTVTLTGGSIPANGSCTMTVRVNASTGGNFVDSLGAGALQTSNGSNAALALATLTVSPPFAVTLGKTFSPASVKAGVVSTLIITLNNTHDRDARLTAPLIERLPIGVVVVGRASTTCCGKVKVGPSTVTLNGGSIPANDSCTVTVEVLAPVAGSYFNSLAAGALQTSEGNNAAGSIATLTVLPVSITLSKSFLPAIIKAGEISTLTITLSNLNAKAARMTAPLIDYLPSDVVVAGTPSSTCGGTVTANSYSSKVIFTRGVILSNSSCTLKVDVTTDYAGTYCNKLPAGALQTDKGSNATEAVATLTVY